MRWGTTGALGASDIDNDGVIEVTVAEISGNSASARIHAISRNGSEPHGWPILLNKGALADHTCFDLDADGQIETIQPVMVDMDDGEVDILRSNGRDAPGSPLQIGETLWSSAAVCDVDLDGDMEFFFGAYRDPFEPIGWVYGYHHDGRPVIGDDGVFAEIGSAVIPAISLVDLAGDSRPEVIAADYLGRIQVWDAEGTRVPGWPRAPFGAIDSIPVAFGIQSGKATGLWASTLADQVYMRDASGDLLAGWPWACSFQIQSQPLAARHHRRPSAERKGRHRPFPGRVDLVPSRPAPPRGRDPRAAHRGRTGAGDRSLAPDHPRAISALGGAAARVVKARIGS